MQKLKNGAYKMKAGQTVYLCFQSDFLLPEAQKWRKACLEMINERPDLHFVFLTKRIEHLDFEIPNNLTIGVSVENQKNADFRLKKLSELNARHKNIICQPLLEAINIELYLEGVELVIVGGEYGQNARYLDFDWVLDIREQCIRQGVKFEFRQCGTYFKKDNKQFKIPYNQLSKQAKLADIDWDGNK